MARFPGGEMTGNPENCVIAKRMQLVLHYVGFPCFYKTVLKEDTLHFLLDLMGDAVR